jgi:hypothetical protein
LACLQIKQLARNVGGIDATRVFVLNLVQAAFATSVAQCLPLRAIEAFDRGFPERRLSHINGPIW